MRPKSPLLAIESVGAGVGACLVRWGVASTWDKRFADLHGVFDVKDHSEEHSPRSRPPVSRLPEPRLCTTRANAIPSAGHDSSSLFRKRHSAVAFRRRCRPNRSGGWPASQSITRTASTGPGSALPVEQSFARPQTGPALMGSTNRNGHPKVAVRLTNSR